MDAASRYIIAFGVLPVGSPGSALAGGLAKALSDPQSEAAASRPMRVRVSDPAAVDAVRALLGPDIPVSVGPVPELEDAKDGLQDFNRREARRSKGSAASYLEDGRIPPAVVADFFGAAGQLWKAAPWRYARDHQVLKLSMPALGLPSACVSIIGNAGQSFGLLVFDSIGGFMAHQRVANEVMSRPRRGPIRDLGADLISVNFETADKLENTMLGEIREHGWKVPDPAAYPVIWRVDRDAVPRPTTLEGYRICTAACAGITRFTEKHYRLFSTRSANPRPRSISTEVLLYGDPSPTAITVSAPFG